MHNRRPLITSAAIILALFTTLYFGVDHLERGSSSMWATTWQRALLIWQWERWNRLADIATVVGLFVGGVGVYFAWRSLEGIRRELTDHRQLRIGWGDDLTTEIPFPARPLAVQHDVYGGPARLVILNEGGRETRNVQVNILLARGLSGVGFQAHPFNPNVSYMDVLRFNLGPGQRQRIHLIGLNTENPRVWYEVKVTATLNDESITSRTLRVVAHPEEEQPSPAWPVRRIED